MSETTQTASGTERATANPPGSGAPVTAAFVRHIKPGKVNEYDGWLHDMTAAAARWPGFQGVTVVRPHGGPRPEYTTILRFDTEQHMRDWMNSTERLALLKVAEEYADEPTDEVFAEQGMEFWFTPHDAMPLSKPPLRWKMWVVLTVLVFIMIQLTRQIFAPLAGVVPLPVTQVASAGIQVWLLTYYVMPWLTKKLAFWLQRPALV